MKKFIITVDTEGDSLWSSNISSKITTENANYIPRFQQLCEQYGFKPVYLVNYEMAQEDRFVSYIAKKADKGLCEIGMHLHAWNMPGAQPLVERTDVSPGLPYLIEYPDDVVEEKVAYMTELIESRFGTRPTTHRAGRWAMDERYFAALYKNGYTVDCSVTPHVNWKTSSGYTLNSCGTDYSSSPEEPYLICGDADSKALYEVPMTIRDNVKYVRKMKAPTMKELRSSLRCVISGSKVWMRILEDDISGQLHIAQRDEADYLMFMLHSSELMPGSRYFPTKEDVEQFYIDMDILFRTAAKKRLGITLKEYRKEI